MEEQVRGVLFEGEVADFVDDDQSALSTHADIELGAAVLPAVATLCRALDGLPLAIELAAARVDQYGIEQLVEVLTAEGEGSTAGGLRPAAPHYVSLAAVISWSYVLLSADDKRALRTLSAFPASFVSHAAHFMGVGEHLPALESKSFMHRTGTDRFAILETVRQYCARRTDPDEHAAVQSQLVDWVRALLESIPRPSGSDPVALTEAFEEEHDNCIGILRSAVGSCDPQVVYGLLSRLTLHFSNWHQEEGKQLFLMLREQVVDDDALRPKVDLSAAELALLLRDFSTAETCLDAAINTLRAGGDRKTLGHALGSRGTLHMRRPDPDYDAAERDILAAGETIDATADPWSYAAVWGNLGAVSHYRGDYAQAIEYYRKALPWREGATSSFNLAESFRAPGDRDEATAHYEQCIAACVDERKWYLMLSSGLSLAELWREDDPGRAAAWVQQAREAALRVEDPVARRRADARLRNLGEGGL